MQVRKKLQRKMPAKKKTEKKTGKKASVKKTKSSSAFGKSMKKKIRKKATMKKSSPVNATKKRTTRGAKATAEQESARPSGRDEELRKILISERRKILAEAKKEIGKIVSGEARELMSSARDDGDISFAEMTEDLNFSKLSTQKEMLNKIDQSLRKLDEGTYGLCEECEGEIGPERLKVLPFAIYCIECKEKIEKMKEFEFEL